MTKRSSAVRLVSSMVLGVLIVSCASQGTPRPRLPEEEQALLELMPNDAFLGVRVDMRALRATPHWQPIEEGFNGVFGMPDAQRHFREADRMVAVLGGFIDAPSYPEPDPEAEYVTPPAWVELARMLHGKLPRAVAVIEGGASSICDTALEGQQRREVRGYQLGVVNGVAMLRRDRVCVVTFEPVLDSLLTQPAGPPADVLGMLAAPGPGGAASIFSYVADYTSPAYAAWVEEQGASVRAALDESRARRRAEEEARAAAVQADPTALPNVEPGADLVGFASAMEEAISQTVVLFLEVSKITMRGMVSSSVRFSHHEGGYDVRSRVTISDEDRAVMWRELVRMYLEIATAAVEIYDIPEEPREILAAALRAIRVEERSDGYEVIVRASDTRVSSLIEYARREAAGTTPTFNEMGTEMPWELISRIDRSGYETPADVVLSLEPSLVQIKALTDRDARRRGLSALSGAYVSLGRYQDAVTLLTASIEEDRAYAETAEYYMRPDVFSGMCGLAAELCQHHLEWGFAEQARAAASMAADQDQNCTNVQYAAFTCMQVAEARLGRAEQALTDLEARTWGDGNVSLFGAARAEILGVLGRWDASYEAARGTCVGPLGAGNCPQTFTQALEAMASGGTALAQHDAAFESVRQSYPGAGSTGRTEDAVASTAAVADCARRIRIAPTDAATLTACVAARDVSVALHGTAHARTARAWMLLASAHAAARDATSAAAAQQEVDALRPSLGPQHVTNLPPPPTPGRGRPRPRAR